MPDAGQHDCRDGEIAVRHRVLARSPRAYCAHPHLVAAAPDLWLLAFNRSLRRGMILHPPQDPEYRNLLMRSADQGRSWSVPEVVPDEGWQGVECAGLTALASGRVLLNQWRFRWSRCPAARQPGPERATPAELLAGLRASPDIGDWAPGQGAAEDLLPWVREGGETWVHVSDDGGRRFAQSRPIDTAPFSGGYGMRGALELPDGEILLPLSDVPHYRRIFALRSRDGGESWSPAALVAEAPDAELEEPAGLVLADGRLLLLLRENRSRSLYRVESDDGGRSWSRPEPTGMRDFPADLLDLGDGRLACVAGRRRAPYGIALYLSHDGGRRWGPPEGHRVRHLPNRDLGYPTLARRDDGTLVVVYYGQDAEGVTGIEASDIEPAVLAALG